MKKTINFMLFLIVIAFAKSTSAQNNEIISGIYIQEVNALQLKKIDCIVPMQIINNPDGSVSYLCIGIFPCYLLPLPQLTTPTHLRLMAVVREKLVDQKAKKQQQVVEECGNV